MSVRRPLYYTFANHMHWVDMEWLWGYGVLPGSVTDMLRLIEETGARGNVNFDGVGYERMAAECPGALAALREAVSAGKVEPVGCSYGQPYGLFHGGESNIRQLAFGVRAVQRLLGVRARTFWEEEFYFFPQLPQLLAQCGFSGASLFFQWTWHTPEIPKEDGPLVMWEGLDGTRLATLTRNELNLHQWPEDFDGLLDRVGRHSVPTGSGGVDSSEGSARSADLPIMQWLELMPTKDWMCRSELLLPRLKELMGDPRFEVRARTAGELIAELLETAGGPGRVPVRRYTLDDAWHGMTLGKNGDNHPRSSRSAEAHMQTAECLAAVAGLFGRPYPSWDVYPTWELEEAWRELLVAQHHDNHECEGLCGQIGERGFKRAEEMALAVAQRTMQTLGPRIAAPDGAFIAFNPTGLMRDLYFTTEGGPPASLVRNVPPYGFSVIPIRSGKGAVARISIAHEKGNLTLSRGDFKVTIDKRRGMITQIASAAYSKGVLHSERPLLDFSMVWEGREDLFPHADIEVGDRGGQPIVSIVRQGREGAQIIAQVTMEAMNDALSVECFAEGLTRPDRGMHAGVRMPIEPGFEVGQIVADHPLGQSAVVATADRKRKYPTGDWMTSPQVFEDIRKPFTALTWLDFCESAGGPGLLCTHDGGQQFFRTERGAHALLTAWDPWDEERFNGQLRARLVFRPHGPMSDGERALGAMRLTGNWSVGARQGNEPGEVPPVFGPFDLSNAPYVIPQSFHRESMKSGEGLPRWAGHRMFRESEGACDHPFVLRLVEWNGTPAEVVLKLAGPVAMAAKTSVMGEVSDGVTKRRSDDGGWNWEDTGWLKVERGAEPPAWAAPEGLPVQFKGRPLEWSVVRFSMRPHEVATIYADMMMGRKQWRDLDAKREVWATVHKEKA